MNKQIRKMLTASGGPIYEKDWSDRWEPHAAKIGLAGDAIGLGAAATGVGVPIGSAIAGFANIPNLIIDGYLTARDTWRSFNDNGNSLGSAAWNGGELILDAAGLKALQYINKAAKAGVASEKYLTSTEKALDSKPWKRVGTGHGRVRARQRADHKRKYNSRRNKALEESNIELAKRGVRPALGLYYQQKLTDEMAKRGYGVAVNDAIKSANRTLRQNLATISTISGGTNIYHLLPKHKNGGLIRKMQTAAGGGLRLKFTPEQISYFERRSLPLGINNSKNYREEGVLALLHQELEKQKKEEEIASRMEMKPVLKKKASKLGEKDLYKLQVNPGAGFVSPVDPVAEFFMYGNPTLKGVGALFKTGLLGAARFAPATQLGNYGRLYFVGNAFKNSFNGTIPTLSSQATSLLYRPVKLNETGLTSLKFFERKPARKPLSDAERQGMTKGERNLKQHGLPLAPYYDYSLINRTYEPWTVNEKRLFVFESPEKAKKLSTIHFSLNEPVVEHMQGSWNNAPTTILLPYRNMRSLAAPVDMAIMDTFFPNYKGLKVSSRGSKILTGDRKTFEYYKSKGLDVEFSPQIEHELQRLNIYDLRLANTPNKYKYDFLGKYPSVDRVHKIRLEIGDNIDRISREWSDLHAKTIPSYEKVNEFGKSEGFDVDKYPYSLAQPTRSITTESSRRLGLDYIWHSDPSNHANIISSPKLALEVSKNSEYPSRPLYIEYLKWLLDHKADYRKHGGKMNILQFLKNGSGIHIKKKNRGSFTRWCGGNVTEECIRRGKASSNPKIRKKATFADNARHFKHKKGGKAFVNGVNVLDSNPNAYKYVKKKYKMSEKKLLGGFLSYYNPNLDASSISWERWKFNLGIDDYLELKKNLLLKQRLTELEALLKKDGVILSIVSNILNKGVSLLASKYGDKNGTPSNTPKGMLNTDPKTFFGYESNI